MGDKIAMLIAVTMIPSFANSTRPRDFEYLSSATSMIMMFEAPKKCKVSGSSAATRQSKPGSHVARRVTQGLHVLDKGTV
jgi:hypothetical protein